MSVIARQSTARTVIVGPILDADGVAVTGAAVGDLLISKNGGNPAALNGSATLTHRNTGHYSLALTTSDTDTVGQAEIVIDDTVNAMPVKVITIVEEAVYDALFAASAAGKLGVNVIEISGDSTAADNVEADYDGTGFNRSNSTIGTCTNNTDMRGTDSALTSLGTNAPANWINAAAVAASALDNKGNWNTTTPPTAIQIRTEMDSNSTKLSDIKAVTDNLATTIPSYVWDAPEGSYEELGSFGLKLGGVPTAIQIRTEMDDNSTQLAAIVADTNAILVDTDTSIPGLLAIVNGKVDVVDGIVEDILVDTGTTLPAILTAIQGATFDASTDSLEAIRNRGDAEWITGSSGGGDATEAKQDEIIADLAAIDTAVGNISTGTGTGSTKRLNTGNAYTVGGSPVANVTVKVFSDSGRTTLVAQDTTGADGLLNTGVYLDAGTYYTRAILSGHAVQDDTIVATGTTETLSYNP